MKNRNQFIEHNGLSFESDTHEWFIDKSLTQYAQTDCGLNEDALPDIFCFWVRDKSTGEYEKVVMDRDSQEVIHSSRISSVTMFIDRLKVEKRFGIDKVRVIADAINSIKDE